MPVQGLRLRLECTRWALELLAQARQPSGIILQRLARSLELLGLSLEVAGQGLQGPGLGGQVALLTLQTVQVGLQFAELGVIAACKGAGRPPGCDQADGQGQRS